MKKGKNFIKNDGERLDIFRVLYYNIIWQKNKRRKNYIN